MVLAAPGPFLTPPSSSPPKTPTRSHSTQIRSQNEEKNQSPPYLSLLYRDRRAAISPGLCTATRRFRCSRINHHRAGVLSREGCPLCNPSSRPLPYRSPGFGMLTGLSSLSDTSPWSTRYSHALHQSVLILGRFSFYTRTHDGASKALAWYMRMIGAPGSVGQQCRRGTSVATCGALFAIPSRRPVDFGV